MSPIGDGVLDVIEDALDSACHLSARHDGTYGSPRITAELRPLAWRVSENSVTKLIADWGLIARCTRKRRGTTRPAKSARRAPRRG
jgi:putative transposase